MDPSEKLIKTLTLYEMLVALMKDEEKVTLQIKESLKEVMMSSLSPVSPVQRTNSERVHVIDHACVCFEQE